MKSTIVEGHLASVYS